MDINIVAVKVCYLCKVNNYSNLHNFYTNTHIDHNLYYYSQNNQKGKYTKVINNDFPYIICNYLHFFHMFDINNYIHYMFNYRLHNIYQNMHNFRIYFLCLKNTLYNWRLKKHIRHILLNYINSNKSLFHYRKILVSKDSFNL